MRIKKFVRSNAGNFAISFGLMFGALALAVGAAIDIGRASFVRSDATSAADAAVLAAVQTTHKAILDGKSESEAINLGEKQGKATFIGNFSNPALFKDVVVKVQNDKGATKGTVAYQVISANTITSPFLGKETLIKNTVEATAGGADDYIQISVVIDNSSSMGIGASLADQQKMVDYPAMNGCAFACHIGSTTTVSAAKDAGATLRIDVAKQAVSSMLNELNAKGYKNDEVEVAVYTYSNFLRQVAPPTDDISAVTSSISGLQLEQNFGEGGTNMRYALSQLAADLPKPGNGESKNDRKSFVIVLGDGVENNTKIEAVPADPTWTADTSPNYVIRPMDGSYDGFTTVQAPDAASCDPLKALGHEVMMVQVAYVRPINAVAHLAPRLDFIENTMMGPGGHVAQNFKACASKPEYYFFANESDKLKPAFQKVLNAITSSLPLRLTY